MTDPHDERPYLAEWWPRVGATLLDLLIVWAIVIAVAIAAAIVAAPFGGDERRQRARVAAAAAVIGRRLLGLTMAARAATTARRSASRPRACSVVRDDGRPVTFKTAFVRDVLLKYVVGNVVFGIGWIVDSLWPLGEKENRALHDLAVKTHVVSTAPPPRPQIVQHAAGRPSTRSSRRRSRATSTPRAGSRPRSAPPCSRRSCRSARSHARSTR